VQSHAVDRSHEVSASAVPAGDHTFALDDMIEVAQRQEERLAKKQQADLAILDMRGEGLEAIPLSLWGTYEGANDMAFLKHANFDNNSLHCLPPEAFFMGLSSLQELNLSHNHLQNIPVTINMVPQLRILRMNSNNLKAVCPEIAACKRLQVLELESNGLLEIPGCLGTMVSLQCLRLRNNKLTTLPAELGSAPALADLDVSTNELKSIMQIVNVRELHCTALHCLPHTVIT
jgi:Leucine-rich repeat (LRR) protein